MEPLKRFIEYTKIWTTSDENSGAHPSAEREKDLSLLLMKHLKEVGLEDAYMDEWGNVYAHLEGEGTRIGFNAHIDTATNISGKDVKAQIHKKYQGEDIKLNDVYTLSMKDFPLLKNAVGSDLVTTSGDTLLGGDDKAGLAIIISALEYLHEHPEIKHHPLSICFTTDEEIGEGPLKFDVKRMNAEYAYSVDGSFPNEVAYENFNASSMSLDITGIAIHPGEGKGKLINAILILNELINSLPKETPFESDIHDGYWHIEHVDGNSEHLIAHMILRDFDYDNLKHRERLVEEASKQLMKKYPGVIIKTEAADSYYNMKPYVMNRFEIIENAQKAIKKAGMNPISYPIRGGTDGATFSKMGLITPNLGTGSYNHHGRFEYLVVDEFYKMIEVVKNLMILDD